MAARITRTLSASNQCPNHVIVSMTYIRSAAFALLFLTMLAGCGQSNTELSTGMRMSDALSKMQQRKLKPSQMAYGSAHNAFDLIDGRTVILFGNTTVEQIDVITNPDEQKSNRKTKSVAEFSF